MIALPLNAMAPAIASARPGASLGSTILLAAAALVIGPQCDMDARGACPALDNPARAIHDGREARHLSQAELSWHAVPVLLRRSTCVGGKAVTGQAAPHRMHLIPDSQKPPLPIRLPRRGEGADHHAGQVRVAICAAVGDTGQTRGALA